MCRNNAEWLAQLASYGAAQQSALIDLRERLLDGLRRGLSSRAALDEEFLEDTVQDSLARILERLEQFDGRSRFVTWATSIAIRVAITELRRRRWKDVSLDSFGSQSASMPERAVDPAPSPADHYARQVIVETLYKLISNQLTEKQRKALLAELKGMPQDEIARQLGSSRNAIYKLTHDARKRLRRGFEKAGYCAEDIYAVFAKQEPIDATP